MSVISKVKTVFWYIRNPSYYKQLLSLIESRLFRGKKENTRAVAEIWCNNNAIDTKEALHRFNTLNYKNIDEVYPDIFKEAKEAEIKAPVKMGGAGNITLLYYLCEISNASNVIETGVAYGWSSLSILLSINKRPSGKLISTDMPYAKMNNEDYVGCVVPNHLKKNWTLLRVPDNVGLPIALKEFDQIDLCHYDSDKSYKGRMWGYPKLWEKLKPGGIFVSDDIGDNIAFKEFCSTLNLEPIIVNENNRYVGILVKP